jgi:nucleoside-diphosphate-sugar epimerase
VNGQVLVTGGSGFIGSALIGALRADGREVLALARSDASAKTVEKTGASAVRGDVLDPASLEGLPGNLDAVVHLAAVPLVRPGTPPKKSPFDLCRSSRVDGTRNLMRALEASPPRVVVSASAGAYPPGSDRRKEDHPLWTENRYGALVEEWERAARSDAFPVVRLRIPPAYGPSTTGGLGAVFLPSLLDGKGPKVIGNPREPGSYAHVDDVVAAILACIDGVEAPAVYNVCDDTPVTPREFAAAASDAFGAGKPSSVPAFLVKLVLGKDLLGLFQTPPPADNGRLKADLGWAPAHPSPADGWRAIARELRGKPD